MIYMSFKAFPQIKKLHKTAQREAIRRIIVDASLGAKFAVSTVVSVLLGIYTLGLVAKHTGLTGDALGFVGIGSFFLYALIGHFYIINIVVKNYIERNMDL